MPTPPRKIEQVSKARAGELPALETHLSTAIDFLKLARIYAQDGAPNDAGARLEACRAVVGAVLDDLNTFRAAAPKKKARPAVSPATEG